MQFILHNTMTTLTRFMDDILRPFLELVYYSLLGVTTQNSKEKVQLQHSVAAELQHSYSELQQSYRKCCSRVIASCSRVIVSNSKWISSFKHIFTFSWISRVMWRHWGATRWSQGAQVESMRQRPPWWGNQEAKVVYEGYGTRLQIPHNLFQGDVCPLGSNQCTKL